VKTAEVYLLTRSPAFQPFTYSIPPHFAIEPGSLVAVPFRNGFDLGVVAELAEALDARSREMLKPVVGLAEGPAVRPPFGKLLLFLAQLAMCSPSEMFAQATFGNAARRSALFLSPGGRSAPVELRTGLEVVRMMLPRKRTRISSALVGKLMKSVGFSELLALVECGALVVEGHIGLGVQDAPAPPPASRQKLLFPPGAAGIQLDPELALAGQIDRALTAASLRPTESYPAACRRVDWRSFLSSRSVVELLTRRRGRKLVLVPTEWHVHRFLQDVPARFRGQVLAFDTSMKVAEFRLLAEQLASSEPTIVVGKRSAQFLAMYAEFDEIVVFDPTAPQFRAEQYPRYDTFANLMGLGRATGRQVTMLPLAPLALGVWEETLSAEVVALPPSPGERIDRIAELVAEHAQSGQQLLVYNNAVGGGQEVFCAACGEGMRCSQCGRRLVFVTESSEAACRGCGYREKAPRCQDCGSQDLGVEIIGVVGLTRLVRKLLRESGKRPTPRVGPLDGSRREKIRVPNLARTDVLIGTSTLLTPLEFYRPKSIIYEAQELFRPGPGGIPEAAVVEEATRLSRLYGINAGRVVIAAPQALAEAIRAQLGPGGARAREELNGIRRQFQLPPYNVRVHFTLYSTKAKALKDFAEEMKGQLDFANRIIEWDLSRTVRTHRKGTLAMSGSVLLDRFSAGAFYDLRKRGKGKRIDLVYWPQYY
jgi:primosomal protein N'